MQRLSLLFEKNLFLGVIALFIFIPLYPKFPLFNIPGTYVAIRTEDFLIALVALCWLVAVIPNIKNFLKQNIVQAILIFWFFGGLSLFSGIFVTQTVTPHLGILHYLRRIEVMLLFFIAWQAFKTRKQIKAWLTIMLVTTLIIVLYGFGQQWLSFPVISTTNKEFSKGLILFLTPDARVNSTFAGHYDLAAYLAIFLTMATALLIYYKSLFKRVIIAGVSLLGFILLALTAARVSFVATIAGVTSVLWFSRQKKLILVLIGLIFLAFIISPELRHRTIATLTVNLYGGGGPKYTPPPQKINPTKTFSIENGIDGSSTPFGVPVDVVPGEPINTTELGVYRSFGIRLNEEWPRAIRTFTKNPILGTGYSSISIATDNDYLRSLGETGFLGTISLALIWVIIFKKIWRFIKLKTHGLSFYLIIGIFAALLAMFLNAIFIDILESSKISQILWMLSGVGFATINMEDEWDQPFKSIKF